VKRGNCTNKHCLQNISEVMKMLMTVVLVFFFSLKSFSQVWQWSVSVDNVSADETKTPPTAFLWIPENCKKVRAVIVGQHNMIEEGIFEHPDFRKKMSEIGFAIVWVSPMFHMSFDFNKNADEDFNYMMKKLADSSGYKELEFAPVVPIGHSAAATYPWNFAAWNPQRTLAVISVHGDVPQTKLTGYGRENVEWGNRNIDGVPGLFIMGEYEWWEDRIAPGFDYVSKHPKTPITFFCDAGHGHFDYSDALVNYIAFYIKKAAAYRLPKQIALDKIAQLKFIDPQNGWLIDKWRKDSLPTAPASSYKNYKGNRYSSSWCFDKDVCDATEKFYAAARGKKEQHLGLMQNGQIVNPDKSHANYNLKFIPENDGISFHVKAFFADSTRMVPVADHARSPLHMNKITGPVKKINDSTFQICFDKTGFNNSKRSNDIWLIAVNDGDEKYKSFVQQADLHFPLFNTDGQRQQITFNAITNQKQGTKFIQLKATSDAGVPVHFYVKEGPVLIKGSQLQFTKIPPRAKFPVKVTVVAWQYGRSTEPKLQTAHPVEQTFYITK
jgi:hypothetical protein